MRGALHHGVVDRGFRRFCERRRVEREEAEVPGGAGEGLRRGGGDFRLEGRSSARITSARKKKLPEFQR